jgi:hypothetical protein
MPDKLWLVFAALVCICLGLYAIERTLLEILKTMRAMRLEGRVNVASFLRNESIESATDSETSTGAKKAN